MKAKGRFKFKELILKNAGKFNNQKGESIEYPASYSLKVDEIDSDGIHERQYKLPTDSPLLKDLQGLEPYSDIIIDFDVKNYSTGIRLLPVAISSK